MSLLTDKTVSVSPQKKTGSRCDLFRRYPKIHPSTIKNIKMQRHKEKRKRDGFAKMIAQFRYRQTHLYETSN
jgi:hypothetical protein